MDEQYQALNAIVDEIIRTLREDQATCLEKFGDVGTNNFLVDLLERHEKMAWMLRAHMEAKGT